MRRAILAALALALCAGVSQAEAPGINAHIDCGTLSGEGAVRILLGERSLGVVRVVCPAPRGA